MSNELEKSELITNRMIELLDKDKIYLHNEVQLLQHIVNRLNLTTVAQYASQEGISHNGAKNRIKRGKVAGVEMNGITLVVE